MAYLRRALSTDGSTLCNHRIRALDFHGSSLSLFVRLSWGTTPRHVRLCAVLPDAIVVRVVRILHYLLLCHCRFGLCLFPRTLWKERPAKTQNILLQLEWFVGFHQALLALAPSFALIAIAAFDRNDPVLLVALGLFGAIGYGVAISLTPIIRSACKSTNSGLMSTRQILYGNTAPSSHSSAAIAPPTRHAILLSDQEYAAAEIVEIIEAHPEAARVWIDQFNEQGIGGLEDRPRSGGTPMVNSRTNVI